MAQGKKQGENSATDEKKIVKNIPGFYVILRGFFVNICLHLINFFIIGKQERNRIFPLAGGGWGNEIRILAKIFRGHS